MPRTPLSMLAGPPPRSRSLGAAASPRFAPPPRSGRRRLIYARGAPPPLALTRRRGFAAVRSAASLGPQALDLCSRGPTPDESHRNAVKRLSLTDSRPRMEPIVHRAQARFEDVRVDLRRGQIGMAEHHLNRAQVGAALEQMRRERVPHDVWAQRAPQAGLASVALQNLPEADARQRSTAGVDEEHVANRARGTSLATWASPEQPGARLTVVSTNPIGRLLADR